MAFFLGWGVEYKNANTESGKAQIERLKAAQEFRKNEEEQLHQIIALANDFLGAERDYSRQPTAELERKFYQLQAQLAMAKDNFRATESTLAKLEDREPRAIDIEFLPPNKPTGLTVTAQ